jgi:hypothetical protein
MSVSRVIVVTLMMLVASAAAPQEQAREPFMPGVLKKVIFDPTTYAPAVVAWEATGGRLRESAAFVGEQRVRAGDGAPADAAIS